MRNYDSFVRMLVDRDMGHDSPCLVWSGRLNRDGYGVWSQGYMGDLLVHRFLWSQVHGTLGEAEELDHLCRVRACCNVEHLEIVDHAENMARQKAARNACKRGHEFTEANTRIYRGRRICRQCDRERKLS